jgi:hypothetical protein
MASAKFRENHLKKLDFVQHIVIFVQKTLKQMYDIASQPDNCFLAHAAQSPSRPFVAVHVHAHAHGAFTASNPSLPNHRRTLPPLYISPQDQLLIVAECLTIRLLIDWSKAAPAASNPSSKGQLV